jgi:hypothetical protein
MNQQNLLVQLNSVLSCPEPYTHPACPMTWSVRFTASANAKCQPPFPRPPVRPNGCFRSLPLKANSSQSVVSRPEINVLPIRLHIHLVALTVKREARHPPAVIPQRGNAFHHTSVSPLVREKGDGWALRVRHGERIKTGTAPDSARQSTASGDVITNPSPDSKFDNWCGQLRPFCLDCAPWAGNRHPAKWRCHGSTT